jgi:glycine oxidase
MSRPERPDVVVIGAGAIGAGCAYELACAGARVTVIECGEPGGEASGASAGLLSAFTSERTGALATLQQLSRDLYQPLAGILRNESGIDIQHEAGGHLQLCMGNAEARWANELAAEHRGRGERVEYLTAEAVRELEPEVSREARGALLLPRDGWVHTGRLVAALVRAGTRRGVRFLLGQPAEALVRTGNRVTGVRARGIGALEAGAVVLAAGVGSGEIAGIPAALRIRPVKGQMLALAHDPPLFRHAVLREHVYLVPRADGECVVGATAEDGLADKTVTPAGLHWLLTEAVVTVPGLARAPFLRAWAGVRPASPDDLPIVGPWPDLPGLYVATGHFRNGILLTPITAQIIAEWIVKGRSTLPAEPFLPDRLLR